MFETSDGAVCRHHRIEWLRDDLLDQFTVTATRELTVETMNANTAQALQILAVKPA